MNFSRSTRFSVKRSPSAGLSSPVMIQRVRARLSRLGPAADLSHLRQIEILRRAIENSSWPIAKTQAKRPRLKAAFGPAISVGYESMAEYVDVELAARLDLKTAAEELQKHLPAGFSVLSVKSIPRFFPSLEETINVAEYEIHTPRLRGTLAAWQAFAAKDSFLITKKKADRDVVIDARPNVRSWSLDDERLDLVLRFGPGRTLKPERIMQAVCEWPAFEPGDASRRPGDEGGAVILPPDLKIKRTRLFFEKSTGELVEP